jgi:hypothetical protein
VHDIVSADCLEALRRQTSSVFVVIHIRRNEIGCKRTRQSPAL